MAAVGAGFAVKIGFCGDTGATQAIFAFVLPLSLPKEIAADRRVPFGTRGRGYILSFSFLEIHAGRKTGVCFESV